MRQIVVFFCFCCSIAGAVAQEPVQSERPETSVALPGNGLPQNAFFVQAGGEAIFAALKYDRRLGRNIAGLGVSAGAGFLPGGDATAAFFPLAFNYLFGRNNHFAEVAAGTTYVVGELDFPRTYAHGNIFFHHLNAGYRYQSASKKFFFRGGVGPLFFPDRAPFVWPYVGFGLRF